MRDFVFKGLAVVAAVALICVTFAFVSGQVAGEYTKCAFHECKGGKWFDRSCPPTETESRFFAVQTITTTGYGSEITLKSDCVKRLANYAMPLGSFLWGLAISLVWWVLTRDRGNSAS